MTLLYLYFFFQQITDLTFLWPQRKVTKENGRQTKKWEEIFTTLAKIYRLAASRDKFFNARSIQFLTFFRYGGLAA